jgi:hypothetical protein
VKEERRERETGKDRDENEEGIVQGEEGDLSTHSESFVIDEGHEWEVKLANATVEIMNRSLEIMTRGLCCCFI